MDDGAFHLLGGLLGAAGLGNWKAVVVEHSVALSLALTALLLVPLLLGLLPGLGYTGPRAFLDPDEFKELPLVERKQLSHNTIWMKFSLPDPDTPVGLPVGQHISLRLLGADGKEVVRSYTPVSGEDQLGSVDFVIKVYPAGEMTPLLGALQLGQRVGFRGPKGRMEYRPNMKRSIGMIAGGTGITPMYQVMRAILRDTSDQTMISLIYANVAEEDILLRAELDEMAAAYPEQVTVYYVLNNCPPGWVGGSGFVTAEIIREHCPAPAENVMVWRCGPPPMNVAVRKCLDELGYSKEMQFQF
uniref:NADH-cytochrome b5 reductase n=1 Tax=Tetraselmis chuii TaxID=63592 RepID=A0A7S1T145_9CHLO|mmetsp:Transcript_38910/g.69673  ORF Transcript_38910/g.69673 Transcript_38910/m.69673 type:complete len:301 (+) Transcript_38910:104-1006(+)